MPDAILSRGSTSVTIPLLGEPGDLAIARDVGKPKAEFKEVGREDPRSSDHYGPTVSYTLAGTLLGPNAYADAKTLAEDLIKGRGSASSPLSLDVSSVPGYSTYEVAAPSGSALTLTYAPGRLDIVGVQLSLTAVSGTQGGPQETNPNGTANSGKGITLSRGSTSETLTKRLQVKRKVGRPKSELLPVPDQLPILEDINAPASDVFEISGALAGDVGGVSADERARVLAEDIIQDPLGRGNLSLSFNGGLYGLDAYDTFPEGSQAVRGTHSTGEKNIVDIPKLKLRVVDNT